MARRSPQLTLRLDSAADADNPWRTDGRIAYLGASLRLKLDTTAPEAVRIDDELHLPLPPAATPRQIRDAAESWLREEALRVMQNSAAAGRHALRIVLCFGKRSDWAKREGAVLRCHWRLIELPLPLIEQVLTRATSPGRTEACATDLFAPDR
jgi:predicted metal-dependent hydrolase